LSPSILASWHFLNRTALEPLLLLLLMSSPFIMSAPLSFKLVFDGRSCAAMSTQDPFFPLLTWSIQVSRTEDNSCCSVLLTASASCIYTIRGLITLHLFGAFSPAQIKKEEPLLLDNEGGMQRRGGKWEAVFCPVQANVDQSLFVEIAHLQTPSFICYLLSNGEMVEERKEGKGR
jgi:hypothetical protein